MERNDYVETFKQIKRDVHRQLVTSFDRPSIDRISEAQLRSDLLARIERLCAQRTFDLSRDDRDIMVQDVLNELLGYGILQPLMDDPEISDILVNGPDRIYVERDGLLYATDVRFTDEEALLSYIQRIVTRMGRRIDESSPMVDVHLDDGSRLNAVFPPLSLRGPTLSIRRFRSEQFTMDQLVQLGSLSQEMGEFLSKAVQARVCIMFSGGTGAGKTTLLDCLSAFIPLSERIITIEETAELRLQQPDVVALEARPPNIEGRGEVLVRDLIKNALRMRPDRIIVGECRGGEIFDVLQAMITGHDGSMSTIHASDTREALRRMELMCALSGVDLPKLAARHYISAAIRLLVHSKRLSTGERKIVRISEVVGLHEGDFDVKDIFEYQQAGVDKYGRAIGTFRATGYRPRLLGLMHELGNSCSESLFEPRELPAEGSYVERKAIGAAS